MTGKQIAKYLEAHGWVRAPLSRWCTAAWRAPNGALYVFDPEESGVQGRLVEWLRELGYDVTESGRQSVEPQSERIGL